MNRTDRLYAIAEELRRAGPTGRTATTLAERFEVSTRTVKRDVSALQQAGMPIWATGGPGGGYVLDEGATLPPLTFTPGEATAIAVALAGQRALPFGPDGRSALAKVSAAMSTASRCEAAELAGRVWIRNDDAPRSRVTRVIDEALRGRVVVVIDYVDASGNSSARRPVEPMAYALGRDHWYLLAWCRRRRDGRWFRLDRVTDAWLTTEVCPDRSVTDLFGEPPRDVTALSLE